MKNCRIALTLDCNIKCKYCCMKNPEILNTFTKISYKNLIEHLVSNISEYQDLNLTGGEPFTYFASLYILMNNIQSLIDIKSDLLKTPINTNMYVFTNGLLVEDYQLMALNRFENFKGLNLSWHYKKLSFERVKELSEMTSVRLFIQDIKNNTKIQKKCQDAKIPIRLWTKDDCSTNLEEDRFLISLNQ